MIKVSTKTDLSTKNIDVSCYEVEDLAFKIVHLSDLHNTQNDDAILDVVRKIKPEIIAVTGDIAGKHFKYDRSLKLLEKLAAISKVLFVSGNHEQGKVRKEIVKELNKIGVIVLDDKTIKYKNVRFTGLNKNKKKKHIAPTGFNVLLVHEPEHSYLYERYNIILSGHAHGGQWRFFNRGIYSTSQGLFPSLTSGLNPNNTIISRGLGDVTKVPRINNKHEIIVLMPKTEDVVNHSA